MSIKKPEIKTKVPLNGFFLYKREIRDFLKAEYGVSKSHEINALAAKRWALEPQSIKNKYSQLSKEQFRQHKLAVKHSPPVARSPLLLKAEPLHESIPVDLGHSSGLSEPVSLKLPKFNSPNLIPQFQLMNGYHQSLFIDLPFVYTIPTPLNPNSFNFHHPYLNFINPDQDITSILF